MNVRFRQPECDIPRNERLELPATQRVNSNLPRLLSGENHALGKFWQYLDVLCESLPKATTSKNRDLTTVELDEELPVCLLIALAESNGELCDQKLKVRQKGLQPGRV